MALAAGPFDLALLPCNGACLDLPWRQPPSRLPAAMTPEQAIAAGRALGAAHVVPIHYGGFDLEPFYRSLRSAETEFMERAVAIGQPATRLTVGETIEL